MQDVPAVAIDEMEPQMRALDVRREGHGNTLRRAVSNSSMARLARWRNWLVAVLLASGLTAAIGWSVLLPFTKLADREQYAVYSAYIRENLMENGAGPADRREVILIAANATMSGGLSRTQEWVTSLAWIQKLGERRDPPSAWLRWMLLFANIRSHRFDRRFDVPASYELAEHGELSSREGIWHFPRSLGFRTFSSVAFNAELSEALFYAEHLCGLCGGGEFVLLRKTPAGWVIVRRYSTWIS